MPPISSVRPLLQTAKHTVQSLKPSLTSRVKQQLSWQAIRSNIKHTDPAVFWAGLLFVPASVVTPFVMNTHLKNAGVQPAERDMLVRQEVARQLVSAPLYVVPYYLGIILGGVLQGVKSAAKSPSWKIQLLSAAALTTLTQGVLRPVLSNEVLVRWLWPEQHAKTVESSVKPPSTGVPFTLERTPLASHPSFGYSSGLSNTQVQNQPHSASPPPRWNTANLATASFPATIPNHIDWTR